MRPWEWKFLDWVEKHGDRVGISILLALFVLVGGCAALTRVMRLGGFTLLEVRYEIPPANSNDNSSGSTSIVLDGEGGEGGVGGVLHPDQPGPQDDPGAEGKAPGDPGVPRGE